MIPKVYLPQSYKSRSCKGKHNIADHRYIPNEQKEHHKKNNKQKESDSINKLDK